MTGPLLEQSLKGVARIQIRPPRREEDRPDLRDSLYRGEGQSVRSLGSVSVWIFDLSTARKDVRFL
jgi:hypothetical protein